MIRRLFKADVPECLEIVHENWNDEVANRFYDEVQHSFGVNMKWPPQYFIYERNLGEIAAFAGMMPSWLMHGVWDLIWINVRSKYQGQGIGLELTKYRLNRIQNADGAVVHLMTQSPDYFTKLNFKISESYNGGWFLMSLQIKELKL